MDTQNGVLTGITTGSWWTDQYTPSISYYQTVSEPSYCVGKAHVFECEHVTHCKCKAVERVMPKPAPAEKRKRR